MHYDLCELMCFTLYFKRLTLELVFLSQIKTRTFINDNLLALRGRRVMLRSGLHAHSFWQCWYTINITYFHWSWGPWLLLAKSKGVFTLASFGPVKMDQSLFPMLVWTMGAGVNTLMRTQVWTKQADQDPFEEFAYGPRSGPTPNIISLFGVNELP